MKKLAESLRVSVRVHGARLRVLRDPAVSEPRAPGKWSKKQILGHLIDSALNNHQRFVRAQIASTELEFPGYQQDAWVSVQGYQLADWERLVDLWRAINLHLSHLIEHIPVNRLEVQCRIGGGEPVTLQYLAEDYLKHLEHHLEQL